MDIVLPDQNSIYWLVCALFFNLLPMFNLEFNNLILVRLLGQNSSGFTPGMYYTTSIGPSLQVVKIKKVHGEYIRRLCCSPSGRAALVRISSLKSTDHLVAQ